MRALRDVLLASVVLFTALPAGAESYVAPVPKDSVPFADPAERDPTYRVFLSKQTPEEVQAFYASTTGPFTKPSSDSHEAHSPVVLSYDQVLKILQSRHRDLTLADDLSITIKWKVVPAGHGDCMGDFFQQLYVIAQAQKRQAEFAGLCKQYGYLDYAFFQKVPDSHRPGKWIDADKDILARAHATHVGQPAQGLATNAAETALKLQQLILSGHAEEAKALAEQLKQQTQQITDTALDWDAWVKVLKEGDGQAYRTWIFLPTHPSTW
ncbi:MAG TPA: hypothetical protein VL131_01420 [Gammaproteobacteria bacterium]|nr:hypothetical protein [Gammaproteobacteria bacterium]